MESRCCWLNSSCALLASSALSALSPYSLRPEQDLYLVGAAAAARGYAEWLDIVRSRDTTDFRNLDRNTINPLDRWAIGYYSRPLDQASTVLTAAEFGVPVLINLWDIKTGKEAPYGVLTDFVIHTEVYGFSSSLAIYAKALRLHARPLAFTSHAPESARRSGDARSSFFSAHTTSAFAAAVFTVIPSNSSIPIRPWCLGSGAACLEPRPPWGRCGFFGQAFPFRCPDGSGRWQPVRLWDPQNAPQPHIEGYQQAATGQNRLAESGNGSGPGPGLLGESRIAIAYAMPSFLAGSEFLPADRISIAQGYANA